MGKSTIHVNECHACRGHDLHGKWFPSRARATLSSKQRLSMKYIYIPWQSWPLLLKHRTLLMTSLGPQNRWFWHPMTSQGFLGYIYIFFFWLTWNMFWHIWRIPWQTFYWATCVILVNCCTFRRHTSAKLSKQKLCGHCRAFPYVARK